MTRSPPARQRPALVVAALLSIAAGRPVGAHEFWLDLERGHVEPGESIVGDLKVGQRLRGESWPYFPERFRQFSVTREGRTRDLDGRLGDIPAVSLVEPDPGLLVISQQTTDFRLDHDDWDDFRSYLEDEGIAQFAERHRDRNLPETGFAERYSRSIKALVQVGPVDESDADERLGMPIELVARSNPYADGSDALAVTLYWRRAPLPDWNINVFHDTGEVTLTRVRTDVDGRAVVPLAGAGQYLLSAVQLEPVDEPPVVWHSHWAALSFRTEAVAR